MNMFSKVFGSRSQREVKRIMPLVDKIESLRPEMQKLSDEELKGKTREMIFFRRHSQLSVRPASVFWAWSISAYSLSVVLFSTRVVLQR